MGSLSLRPTPAPVRDPPATPPDASGAQKSSARLPCTKAMDERFAAAVVDAVHGAEADATGAADAVLATHRPMSIEPAAAPAPAAAPVGAGAPGTVGAPAPFAPWTAAPTGTALDEDDDERRSLGSQDTGWAHKYEETDLPFAQLRTGASPLPMSRWPRRMKYPRECGVDPNGVPLYTEWHRHPDREYQMVRWEIPDKAKNALMNDLKEKADAAREEGAADAAAKDAEYKAYRESGRNGKWRGGPTAIVGKYWEPVPGDEQIVRRYVAAEGVSYPGRIQHNPEDESESGRACWFVYRINPEWLNGTGMYGTDPVEAKRVARKMMARRAKPRAGVNAGDQSLDFSDLYATDVVNRFEREAQQRQDELHSNILLYRREAAKQSPPIVLTGGPSPFDGGPTPDNDQAKTLAVYPLRTGEMTAWAGWQLRLWHYESELDGTQRVAGQVPTDRNVTMRRSLLNTTRRVDETDPFDNRITKKGVPNPLDPFKGSGERCFVDVNSRVARIAAGQAGLDANGRPRPGQAWVDDPLVAVGKVPLNRYLLASWRRIYNENRDHHRDNAIRDKRASLVAEGKSDDELETAMRKYQIGLEKTPKLWLWDIRDTQTKGPKPGIMTSKSGNVDNYAVLLFNLDASEAPPLFAGRGGDETVPGILPQYKQPGRRKIVATVMRGGKDPLIKNDKDIKEDIKREGNAAVDAAAAAAAAASGAGPSSGAAPAAAAEVPSRYDAINKARLAAVKREKMRIASYNAKNRANPRLLISPSEAARMIAEKGRNAGLAVANQKPETLHDVAWREGISKHDPETGEVIEARVNAGPGTTKWKTDADEASGVQNRAEGSQKAANWPLLRAGDIRPVDAVDDSRALTDDLINEDNLVVKFFPMCGKYAFSSDLPTMPDNLTGRDLDIRNRPFYANDPATRRAPNPHNVPSVWKMRDMRTGGSTAAQVAAKPERQGVAWQWATDDKRAEVAAYYQAQQARVPLQQAADAETDDMYDLHVLTYQQDQCNPRAAYAAWYNELPFGKRDGFQSSKLWLPLGAIAMLPPAVMTKLHTHAGLPLDSTWAVVPEFDKDDEFAEEEDFARVAPPPDSLDSDPGLPLRAQQILDQSTPLPEEPTVPGGVHQAGPSEVVAKSKAGTTDVEWKPMPLNAFGDNVFSTMWNHLSTVGMTSATDRATVGGVPQPPLHINAGYTTGQGRMDAHNHCLCIGYAIYDKAEYDAALLVDPLAQANEAARERALATALARQRERQQELQQQADAASAAAAASAQPAQDQQDGAASDALVQQAREAQFNANRRAVTLWRNAHRVGRYIDSSVKGVHLLGMIGPDPVRMRVRDDTDVSFLMNRNGKSRATASKWQCLRPNDTRCQARPTVDLMDELKPDEWWEEWLDGTTDLQPLPNPVLYESASSLSDPGMLDGLNRPNGLRWESSSDFDKRVEEWERADGTDTPRLPWRPERHEANYSVCARLAGVPSQVECDRAMAGSRANWEPDEEDRIDAASTLWSRRVAVARKYLQGDSASSKRPGKQGEPRAQWKTEREHRLMFRLRLARDEERRRETELAAEKAGREARVTAESQAAGAAAAAAAAARASEAEPRRDRDEAGASSLERQRSRGEAGPSSLGGEEEAGNDEEVDEDSLFGPDDDDDPFGPDPMDTGGVHSEDLDSVHFHVLGDDHRGSPAAARKLAVALATLSLGKYNTIRARLLPRQQVAMDLSRDQGRAMLEKM